MIGCYRFFTQKIKEIADPIEFLSFIVGSQLWVTINLGEKEDEQKIFDSINTAGLKLTATDIIKNALFAKARQNPNYERLYRQYWECTFETDAEVRKFWDTELATGRIKRVRSEIFLHAFAIVEGFFRESDSLENLSVLYKKKTREFSEVDLEKFLVKIKEYAAIYISFPNIEKDTLFYFENGEQRLFHIL